MSFNPQQLTDDIVPTVDAPTAAGTSTIDSTAVDMAGYGGVLFIVRLGTAAANNNIRCQQDVVVGMGGAADLTGTLVASGANNVVMLEVIKPAEQFLRCRITRGTSTTIDSMVAIRFGARLGPTVIPASVSFESWAAPAEGTA